MGPFHIKTTIMVRRSSHYRAAFISGKQKKHKEDETATQFASAHYLCKAKASEMSEDSIKVKVREAVL